jgi:hypothetical protein
MTKIFNNFIILDMPDIGLLDEKQKDRQYNSQMKKRKTDNTMTK